MRTLLIATSPRSTWITAPDAATAVEIRELLGDAWSEVRRRGRLDPLALDVGIGIDAFEAGTILIESGYSFKWHDDQHQLNRDGTAWGIPVQAD